MWLNASARSVDLVAARRSSIWWSRSPRDDRDRAAVQSRDRRAEPARPEQRERRARTRARRRRRARASGSRGRLVAASGPRSTATATMPTASCPCARASAVGGDRVVAGRRRSTFSITRWPSSAASRSSGVQHDGIGAPPEPCERNVDGRAGRSCRRSARRLTSAPLMLSAKSPSSGTRQHRDAAQRERGIDDRRHRAHDDAIADLRPA